nr:hypothetical protein [uncultured Deefgea sp.]
MIEILVAMAIGLFLLSAAASIGLSSITFGSQISQQAGLQNTLKNILTETGRELRRAGYSRDSNTAHNFRQIRLLDPVTKKDRDNNDITAYQCILFRYDHFINTTTPGNGTLDQTDVVGFKFKDNQVFTLINSTNATAVVNCNTDSDGWTPINSNATTMPKVTDFYIGMDNTATQTSQSDSTGRMALGSATIYVQGQAIKTGSTEILFELKSNETIQIRNQPIIQ